MLKHKNEYIRHFCIDCNKELCNNCYIEKSKSILSNFINFSSNKKEYHENHRLIIYIDYIKKQSHKELFKITISFPPSRVCFVNFTL